MSFIKPIQTAKNTFLVSTSGLAAIEFALVAPLLVAIVLVVADVNQAATQAANMQTAVRAGIQYALNNGSDMTIAQARANAAWTYKPTGGTVTAQLYCTCGTALNSCSSVCPDNSVPYSYVSLTATGTIGGSIIHYSKTTTETVRLK